MSVAELPDQYESSPPPSEFGRTPPQDVAAEQSVLGGMLLSKDAIADVVEIVRGTDFYRPAHESVYEAIIDLYGRGEPADAVTVSAELQKRGDLGRVGGAPYLHTLVSSVPSAANAGFYAEIVRERALLRRLVDAGTRIVQLGYGSDGDADDIVDRAQAEVYSITEKRAAEDYAPLSDIMEGTLDEIEAIGSRGGAMVGVPTGFTDLDQLTNGLHPGQLAIVAARPAVGKALALDTALPTPSGWTTMGEVQVGDQLMGADGKPTMVVAATDVMSDRPCYEVEFSDGSVIVADAEHQWVTTTRASRRASNERLPSTLYRPEQSVNRVRELASTARAEPRQYISTRELVAEIGSVRAGARDSVVTTREMAETLRRADGRANYAVPLAQPFDLPAVDLPLAPYVLGVSLGDGHSEEAWCSSSGMAQRVLRTLGVLNNKHIPMEYLRASVKQRRALLAGLLDSDGYANSNGVVQFAVTTERLARDVRELVHSLGYRTGWTTKRVPGRSEATSTSYCVTFTPGEPVFRLTRKLERQRLGGGPRNRTVVAVRPVSPVPVRCVQVDAEDHLYLAGQACIPTHNSTLGLDVARATSIKNGLASVIFSLEMTRNEITMRLLSAEAKVPLHHMRAGQMTDDDWNKIARCTGEVSAAPLFIDDSPNMTMMEIRAKCRRLKQRNDLRLVIIDYLQLMTSGKRVESRQQEVSEFSRALKLLAKELDVPVIAISQLNRGPEQRQDRKPMLSDLRESGCLTASTRVMRADTGAEVTLGELMATGERDVPVWALDDSLRYVPRTMTHAFPSGRRETFRLRMASGKTVDATTNHPFLTYGGWKPVGELAAGDRLAVPRHVPAPLVTTPWEDDEVVTLAHWLTRGRPNPVPAWLDDLGLFGLRAHEKFVPEEVFSLPKAQIALFLKHLWGIDGSVKIPESGHGGRIYYTSTSRRLLDGVANLLLRFGISTGVRAARGQSGDQREHMLDVSGRDEQLRFLREIGCHGARSASCDRLLAILESVEVNTNVDAAPVDVWQQVRSVMAGRETTDQLSDGSIGADHGGVAVLLNAPSRPRLGRIAALLDDADLEMYATNDILWDTIVAVEPLGEQDVYDATVMGVHNFIANGIASHNSIEQDADMVILLNREDAYEKESPRAGEADFIVAKHRNGPTATITVAFQGHYSRFVDMAQ